MVSSSRGLNFLLIKFPYVVCYIRVLDDVVIIDVIVCVLFGFLHRQGILCVNGLVCMHGLTTIRKK